MMNNGKGMRWRKYSGEIIKPMTVRDSKKTGGHFVKGFITGNDQISNRKPKISSLLKVIKLTLKKKAKKLSKQKKIKERNYK